MAALFSTTLPLETVAAIQRGNIGLEQVLQDLSFAQDVPGRVVRDVVHNIIKDVMAIPFVVSPKAYHVPVKNPFHQGMSPMGQFDTPIPAPRTTSPLPPALTVDGSGMSRGWEKSATPSPASRFAGGFSDFGSPPSLMGETKMADPFYTGTTALGISPKSHWPVKSIKYIDIRIDGAQMGHGHITMRESLELSRRRGLYKLPFSDNDGFYHTLHSLGITTGTTIYANRAYQQMAITVVDSMMKEEKLWVLNNYTFQALVDDYAEAAGVDLSKLAFTIFPGGWRGPDVTEATFHKTLEGLGLEDGDKVTVKPDMGFVIEFSVRDAMNKTYDLSLKNTDTVTQLDDKVHSICFSGSQFEFEFDGRVFHSNKGGVPDDTIEDIGIYDGAEVAVRPHVAKETAPAGHAEYTIEFTVRDAMNKEHVLRFKNTATVAQLDADYRGDYRAAGPLQFEFETVIFGNYEGGFSTATIEQIGIYDGAIVTARPYIAKEAVVKQATGDDWDNLSVASSSTLPFNARPGSAGGWGRSRVRATHGGWTPSVGSSTTERSGKTLAGVWGRDTSRGRDVWASQTKTTEGWNSKY